jgi:hypothetical protein
MDKLLKENPGTAAYLGSLGNETKLFTVILDYISNLPPEVNVENNPHYAEALRFCISYLSFRLRDKKTGNLIAKDIADKVMSEDDSSDILLAALEQCVMDHNLESLARKGLIDFDILENTASLTKFGTEIVELLDEIEGSPNTGKDQGGISNHKSERTD